MTYSELRQMDTRVALALLARKLEENSECITPIAAMTDDQEMDKALERLTLVNLAEAFGPVSYTHLPEEMKIKPPEVAEYSDQFLMEKEKEAIGFYLTRHPVDEFFASGKGEGCMPITDLIAEEPDRYSSTQVCTVGLIRGLRTVYTLSLIHI